MRDLSNIMKTHFKRFVVDINEKKR
jgi:hypothetical protein